MVGYGLELIMSTYSEYMQNIVFNVLDKADYAYGIVGDKVILAFLNHELALFIDFLLELIRRGCVVVLC